MRATSISATAKFLAFGQIAPVLTGCGHGISEIAQKYFAKDFAFLSERQIVGLLSIVANPVAFAPGTAKAEKRIDEILAKAKRTN